MGWRGKYRDSLGSLRRPGKKETPKVSGNGPCSLNIRSNPPALLTPICVELRCFARLMKTVLFEVRWEGVFLQGVDRRVVFGLSMYLV